jgi:hypothetical protein
VASPDQTHILFSHRSAAYSFTNFTTLSIDIQQLIASALSQELWAREKVLVITAYADGPVTICILILWRLSLT